MTRQATHTGAPEMVHEAAWRHGRERPDEVVIWQDDGSCVTYGEIADEARSIARAMMTRGLQPGDVVSFQLPNWKEAAAINIAASALGLVVNPIVPIYRENECEHMLKDSQSRLVFIPATFRGFDYARMFAKLSTALPDLREIVVVRGESEVGTSYADFVASGRDLGDRFPAVDPGANKLLMYTSGTTGRSKGVLHSHLTLAASHDNMAYWKVTSRDVIFMPSPVTHITGYSWGLELPFLVGAKSALLVAWDAARGLDCIDRVGATLTVGSTVFLQDLVEEAARQKRELPSLRMFACGGAPVSPELIYRANEVLPNCRAHRMYGSTEAPGVTRGWMGPDDLDLAAHTDGKIIGWDVAIVDAAGRRLPDGKEGEITVRGAALMVGYKDPAQTQASLSPDGFFRTGDLGRVTAEGAILVTGRKKDLIIRGGENISAREIEIVLERHPQIRQAAVVAMPHARLGETVCAFIVPDGSAPCPAEILEFVKGERLARQKTPERIEVVADLPCTASGKVRKDALRDTIAKILLDEADALLPA